MLEMGQDRIQAFVDFRMILRTSLVVVYMCELIHCIFHFFALVQESRDCDHF